MQEEKEAGKKKSKASRSFVIALSLVSIVGFVTIVTESLFNYSIATYIESSLLLILGLGLIFETTIEELKGIKENGLGPEMLGKITMIVVGTLAVIAGVLSLPQIATTHPTFLAVKGILSILAIVFIVLQTWITKNE
jgi:hypothetical protein